ncbi:hypothetical protein LXA43DRAFT_123040 [Ganoderma leucocontextum]|nr:hypothetical protein LXA43DRAFT_123040 [Ganoderma leucocontextum]
MNEPHSGLTYCILGFRPSVAPHSPTVNASSQPSASPTSSTISRPNTPPSSSSSSASTSPNPTRSVKHLLWHGADRGIFLTPLPLRYDPRTQHVALVTMGEKYHDFHHQFPMDYRNTTKWYQFDPTKWFIAACGRLSLASHLRVFPANEIRKGELAMQLKKLKKVQEEIRWLVQVDDLPIVGWDKCECPFPSRKPRRRSAASTSSSTTPGTPSRES